MEMRRVGGLLQRDDDETAGDVLHPNRLAEERVRAGYETPERFAAAIGVEPAWYAHIEAGHVMPTGEEMERLTSSLGGLAGSDIWSLGSLSLVSGHANKARAGRGASAQRVSGGVEKAFRPAELFREMSDECHMLLARDEMRWFDRQPGSDHQADVFMNLSCGTQRTPHLLLDTVAVLEKLNVNFLAAAGTPACCGKPFTNSGRAGTAERVNRARIGRSLGWGAKVHVNWCVACQMTSTGVAARRYYADGEEHPVREVQLMTFLAERLSELGDRVPWERPVRAGALAVGHSEMFGPAHTDAHRAVAKLLSMVPGVEVVEMIDGHAENSPCTFQGRDADWTPPAWLEEQDTIEGIQAHRVRLAAMANAKGATLASCSHQYCHLVWSKYASDRLAVKHPVSVVAEALGVAHPDRRQAAMRLGDPDAFLAQTRAVWQSWDLSEERARELAQTISDPMFADDAATCRCDSGGGCKEKLISIDVLAGTARPA